MIERQPKVKTKKTSDPILTLLAIWFWIWMGSMADVWWHSALAATAGYAVIKLLIDLKTYKKENSHDD